MASSSKSTTQRLLKELKEYASNPNEALLHLGPVREDNLLHWEAVLKGVNGTPYEGAFGPHSIDSDMTGSLWPTDVLMDTSKLRGSMAAPHRNPTQLPSLPAHDPIPDPHLAPQHLLHHGGDLSHALDERTLESGVHHLHHTVGHPPASDGSSPGLAAERRCGGPPARQRHCRLGECGPILDGRGTLARARECGSCRSMSSVLPAIR